MFITTETINTESRKWNTILEAVTLRSCDNNLEEKRIKIERLNSIIDDHLLAHILNVYVLPYRDYKEGRTPIIRHGILTLQEFMERIGFTRELLDFILCVFYVPLPEENGNIPDSIVRARQQFLNGKKEQH